MSEYIDITGQCSYSPNHGDTLTDSNNIVVRYVDTSSGTTFSSNIPYNVYDRDVFNKAYKMSNNVTNAS